MTRSKNGVILTINWNQILLLPLADSKIWQSLVTAGKSNHSIQYYTINPDILHRVEFNISKKIFLFGQVAFAQKVVQGYLLQFRKQYNVINHQHIPYLQILPELYDHFTMILTSTILTALRN